MNRYRVTGTLPIHTSDASYQPGEEFDHDYNRDDEAALLHDGRVEIIPATYRVVGGSTVHDTPPGGTFDAALTVGVEQLLVEGGHIERLIPDVDRYATGGGWYEIDGVKHHGRAAAEEALTQRDLTPATDDQEVE